MKQTFEFDPPDPREVLVTSKDVSALIFVVWLSG